MKFGGIQVACYQNSERGSSPTVREGAYAQRLRPPLQSGYCPDNVMYLIQIVDLQSDRRRAGPFEAVKHSNYVCIRHRAWRFDEDSLFDANIFRQIISIAQFVLVRMILPSLLNKGLKVLA